MVFRDSRKGVFALALVVSAALLAGPGHAATTQSSYADEVYAAINSQRTANGVAPLVRVRSVELSAQLHAMDMANREYMDHYTATAPSPVVPDPAGYPSISFTSGMGPGNRLAASGFGFVSSGWGENVAYNLGYGAQSPSVAVNGWMNSSGHRDNILSGSYKGTGVGVAISASGRVYYCQDFVVYTSGQATISSNAELGAGGSGTPPPTNPPPTTPPADTTAPGSWQSLSPASTSSTAPTVRITVVDGGSGLNTTSAEYRYSRDGGYSWSSWRAASCSGSSGTTARQTVTAANVPFNQRSSWRNLIQFRIRDVKGNLGSSSGYRVNTAQ